MAFGLGYRIGKKSHHSTFFISNRQTASNCPMPVKALPQIIRPPLDSGASSFESQRWHEASIIIELMIILPLSLLSALLLVIENRDGPL